VLYYFKKSLPNRQKAGFFYFTSAKSCFRKQFLGLARNCTLDQPEGGEEMGNGWSGKTRKKRWKRKKEEQKENHSLSSFPSPLEERERLERQFLDELLLKKVPARQALGRLYNRWREFCRNLNNHPKKSDQRQRRK
jgi:hypothetical protein